MTANIDPGDSGPGRREHLPTWPAGRAHVTPPVRLDARAMRAAGFPRTRKGFDPEAVRRYLDLVADEVIRLREQIAAAHAETDRIKRHLRQWQTDHATTCRGSLLYNPTRGDWPINQS